MESERTHMRRRRWLALPIVLLLAVAAAIVAVNGDETTDRGDSSGRAQETADQPASRARTRLERRSPSPEAADASDAETPHPTAEPPNRRTVRGGFTNDPTTAALDAGVISAAEAEALRGMGRSALEETPGTTTFLGVRGSAMGGRARSAGRPTDLRGRVTDATNGEPIVGAEVIGVVVRDDGRVRRFSATRVQRFSVTTTDASGAFRLGSWGRSGKPEVAVRALGYRTERRPHPDTSDLWELHPTAGNGRGSVRGRAHDEDGNGLAGLLLFELRGELGDRFSAYAWSDAAGRYRIDGLHAGRWRVRIGNRRAWVDVSVPDGGDGVADFEGDRPDAPPAEPPGSDRRVVLVTGPVEGSVVRAEAGADVFWLAVVEGGVARFELRLGIWVMRRDVDGADPAVLHLEEGAGPQDFTLSK